MTDEILVHISTPATKQNDDLYRSVADVYKNFEPCQRHGRDLDLELDDAFQVTGAQVPHTISALSGHTTPAKGGSNQLDANSLVFSASKDSYGSFPSFVSSEDRERLDSRVYYDDDDGDDLVPVPCRLAKLSRIHVNGRDQTTLKASSTGRRRQSLRAEEEEEEADTAFIEDALLTVQALQSQLPDDYSTTDEDTEEDDKSVVESDGEAEREQDHVQAFDLESRGQNLSSSAQVQSSIPPTETRHGSTNHQETQRLDTTLDLPFSITQDADETQHYLNTGTVALRTPDFSKLPIDAFPPAPAVSIARPSALPSQVTKHLAATRRQNATRFKPRKKSRTIESDERGHWSVDCSCWPQALQYEFWSSLCEHVQSGRLGWATTLHRESKHAGEIGGVRLYGWGEVVEHLWLLMWVCSKGRVFGAGSKWFDADGVAVVEVF